MFRTPVFPDLLSAQNMVRVIEGKIIYRKGAEGKRKLVKLAGVRVIEGSSE